jgi:hypothetical protein
LQRVLLAKPLRRKMAINRHTAKVAFLPIGIFVKKSTIFASITAYLTNTKKK